SIGRPYLYESLLRRPPRSGLPEQMAGNPGHAAMIRGIIAITQTGGRSRATNLIDAIAKKKTKRLRASTRPFGHDHDDLRAARLDARSECSIGGFQTRLNALARSRHAIAKLSSASRRLASTIAAVRIYSSA